jgi:hypothetical protein
LLSSHLSATLTLYAAHHAHAYFAHLIIVVWVYIVIVAQQKRNATYVHMHINGSEAEVRGEHPFSALQTDTQIIHVRVYTCKQCI